MTGPTTESQVARITALANEWLKASLADVAAQNAAGAAHAKAEELRRFLQQNANFIGLAELNAKSAELQKLTDEAGTVGDAARATAAANQAAHDALEAYIKSIVQTPVTEAPSGGFR